MFGLSRLSWRSKLHCSSHCWHSAEVHPSVVMGYFVVTTTTVSEFVAAMERLHLPQQITIPMSVMFASFPRLRKNGALLGTPCGCVASALVAEKSVRF